MKRPIKWIMTLTLLLFAVGVISSCAKKKTDDAGTTGDATPVAETTDTAEMDSMPMDHDDSATDSM